MKCNQICFVVQIEFSIFPQPLAANDYIQIAQYFHTVLIKDVPQLDLSSKSQARRFITLIDTLYDNKVRVNIFIAPQMKWNLAIETHESQVVMSSDVQLQELFSTEKKSDFISDDDRKLMDDLQITPDSVRNDVVNSRCSRELWVTGILLFFYRSMHLRMFSPATKRYSLSNVPFHAWAKCKGANIGSNGTKNQYNTKKNHYSEVQMRCQAMRFQCFHVCSTQNVIALVYLIYLRCKEDINKCT